jgi:hypothetical protein
MAVRYSGDAEVRLSWDRRKRLYKGVVSTPRAILRYMVDRSGHGDPRSPEAYDRAAVRMLTDLQKRERAWRKKTILSTDRLGRLKVERVFQAPCPCGH